MAKDREDVRNTLESCAKFKWSDQYVSDLLNPLLRNFESSKEFQNKDFSVDKAFNMPHSP